MPSLLEMDKELRAFATTRPVTSSELEAAIANRTLRLPGARESLRAVSSTVEQIFEFGYPDDYFDTYASKVRACGRGTSMMSHGQFCIPTIWYGLLSGIGRRSRPEFAL